jgi:hypothetical protein
LYGIDTDLGDHTGKEVRQSIRQILVLAESECGFCVGSEKILVQHYPLPSGDLELFITKLSSISREDRAALFSAEGLLFMENKRGVYRFDTADALFRAVSAAGRKDAKSSLYRDDLGRFYLLIDEEITDGISEFEVFVEYGERLASMPLAVLAEYGDLISEDDALSYVKSDKFLRSE